MPKNCLPKKAKDFIQAARVAHLATTDDKGRPHVIPICFAFDGNEIYSPIDEKPKKTSPLLLKRVRNIQANPHVAVVIDKYNEDWRRLAYVLITGRAKLLFRGTRHARAVRLLRKKYSQYEKMRLEKRPIIRIAIAGWTSWGAV
jgi:coenzyme F420-0:L-glutamate ligase / coenzyme F420-1:gamma-L-glutamate ligase